MLRGAAMVGTAAAVGAVAVAVFLVGGGREGGWGREEGVSCLRLGVGLVMVWDWREVGEEGGLMCHCPVGAVAAAAAAAAAAECSSPLRLLLFQRRPRLEDEPLSHPPYQ